MFQLLKQQRPEVRRNFYFDLTAGLFCGVISGGINAFILVQARRLGATDFQVSFLAAVQFIWMLLSPLWAKLFSAKNPFRTVFIFDGLGRACLLLLLFNASPGWYIFLFSAYYLAGSISGTSYCQAMRLGYPSHIRGTLMSWVRVGISLVSIAAAGLAGFLLPMLGVQRFFALVALIGIISAVSFGQLKPLTTESCEPPAEAAPELKPLQVWREDRHYRHYMLAYFIFGFANLMSLPVYTLFQVDILKVSDGFVALLALVTSLASLVFYFVGGRFIDQSTPLNLTVYLLALCPLIPLIYFLSNAPGPLLLVGVIQGLINAGIDLAALNNVIYFAGAREVSPYMAIHMNLQGLRGTVGPLLAPLVVDCLGYRGFFLFIAILFAAAWWQGMVVLKKDAKLHCATKQIVS